jgi:hypothetical protein
MRPSLAWLLSIAAAGACGTTKSATTIPSTSAEAAPVRGAIGDTVRVIINHVRWDKRDQFDRFVHEVLYPAMVQAAPSDPLTARQMRRARVLRPLGIGRDSTYSYVFLVDPVAGSEAYSFPRLFARVYSESQANEYMQQFRESLARPQESYLVINMQW